MFRGHVSAVLVSALVRVVTLLLCVVAAVVGCCVPPTRPSVDRVDLPFGFETTGCVKNKICSY